MDLQFAVDALIPAVCGGIGWIIKTQQRMESKMDAMRKELREDMEKYVSRETCDARCEGLEARIERMEKRQELDLAQAVNDTHRMKVLYDHMTDEERRAHYAQCLFKRGTEGIG